MSEDKEQEKGPAETGEERSEDLTLDPKKVETSKLRDGPDRPTARCN
jgi:hypothetical protein